MTVPREVVGADHHIWWFEVVRSLPGWVSSRASMFRRAGSGAQGQVRVRSPSSLARLSAVRRLVAPSLV